MKGLTNPGHWSFQRLGNQKSMLHQDKKRLNKKNIYGEDFIALILTLPP